MSYTQKGRKIMTNRELKEKILRSIEERLALEHIDVMEEEYYDLPIFLNDDDDGVGLGLDSIDAIEIIIAIKEDFNVKIGDADMKILKNISSIAEFVNKKLGD